MQKIVLLLSLLFIHVSGNAQDVLVEAESFINKGGWVVDPQFVEQMGSPYLMAHGMGTPVANATTIVDFDEKRVYHVWIRTKNWVPGNWEAPGQFEIIVNGKTLKTTLGNNTEWSWEHAGKVRVKAKEVEIQLSDLTGFNGRCDAIYFSQTSRMPTYAETDLDFWRKERLGETTAPKEQKRTT